MGVCVATLLQFGRAGAALLATGPPDRGVSETIGVLVMVSLTILLAALLGVFVLTNAP